MMAGRTKKETGSLGEKLAGEHLQGLGQHILERNWRSGHLEVDLVTRAPDGLHFVEVKSLVAPVAEDPTSKVDAAKRKHITAAALRYLHDKKPGADLEVFFDIISVVFYDDHTDIQYYPSAWIPIYT